MKAMAHRASAGFGRFDLINTVSEKPRKIGLKKAYTRLWRTDRTFTSSFLGNGKRAISIHVRNLIECVGKTFWRKAQ